ncbi:uncharacterized protein TNCV_18671 [Trichonephila clavipes]|nr:uncharacterized protein TNCV_18671 [Trichonephila clavipes]
MCFCWTLCPKWKTEKQIQQIKTNRNKFYLEARKLIVPQLSQTYAEAIKPSTINSSKQTDQNIKKIVCPPLKLLQSAASLSKQNISTSVPTVSTPSSSIQAHQLPSTSTISES